VVGALMAACVPPPSSEPVRPAAAPVAELELPELQASSLERRAREITVRVRSLGCTQFGLGSGFVLPDGIVVTNRHVLEAPREVTVNTWDGRRLQTDVAGVATDSDLALLRLDDARGLPVAELRSEPVEVGEPLVVVGYPGGGPARISRGEVVGLVDGQLLGEPAQVLRIDARIEEGNSGGPVLDLEGRVIGVVFAVEVDTGRGLAVPATTLLERLDTADLASPGSC
jgi:S1-C subfamily serine protease